MKKSTKLKICNWSLLAPTIVILISGLQLEATHSKGLTPVWIHIIMGVLFLGMVAYWHEKNCGRLPSDPMTESISGM